MKSQCILCEWIPYSSCCLVERALPSHSWSLLPLLIPPTTREEPGVISSVEEETGHAQLSSSVFPLFRDLPATQESMFWLVNDMPAEVLRGRKKVRGLYGQIG